MCAFLDSVSAKSLKDKVGAFIAAACSLAESGSVWKDELDCAQARASIAPPRKRVSGVSPSASATALA